MILGIGSDLVDMRRIEAVLGRFQDHFLNRIFTPREIESIAKKSDRVRSCASRFAAKEACAKALGTGFRQGIGWQDIQIISDALRKPTLDLDGAAVNRLEQITPKGYVPRLHLSLTDEYPYAQAFVVISAEKIEEDI